MLIYESVRNCCLSEFYSCSERNSYRLAVLHTISFENYLGIAKLSDIDDITFLVAINLNAEKVFKLSNVLYFIFAIQGGLENVNTLYILSENN